MIVLICYFEIFASLFIWFVILCINFLCEKFFLRSYCFFFNFFKEVFKNLKRLVIFTFESTISLEIPPLWIFLDQILTYEKVKGLSLDETVAFLKSKIKGPARQYTIEAPGLYKDTDFEFTQNWITGFFAKTSARATLNDLNTLTILPHESIKKFAHRLNVLITKAYPEILDKVAANHIKLVKFLSCLTSSIRRKLLVEDIKTYRKLKKEHRFCKICLYRIICSLQVILFRQLSSYNWKLLSLLKK